MEDMQVVITPEELATLYNDCERLLAQITLEQRIALPRETPQYLLAARKNQIVVGVAEISLHSPAAGCLIVYVNPGCQGRHIGSRLIDAAISYAQQQGISSLRGVVFSNSTPEYMITKRGFVACRGIDGQERPKI